LDYIIVSGSADSTLRLWDLAGNPIGAAFEGHSARVWSVAFSPVRVATPKGLDYIIVSGSSDGTVRLWDLAGNPIGAAFEGHSATVWSVAFSPDSQSIVSGSDDGTLRLWPIWLATEGGWLRYTCNHLRGYLLVRSATDDVAREARRTCERYAWH
jgi:WD40 repeat protein